MDEPLNRRNGAQGEGNPLGTAGFVVSLVGLVASCGLLSPIGAVMSLVAMSRRPNGLAIAGFVIGLVGSLWVLVAIVGIAVLGIGGAAAVIGLGPYIGVVKEQSAIGDALFEYWDSHGVFPASLDDLSGLPSELRTDHWGTAYRYEVTADGSGASVISDGPDKQPGTADDLRHEVVRWSGSARP